MIISSGVAQNTKILSVSLRISGTVHHMIGIFGGGGGGGGGRGGLKGKKMTENDQFQSALLYISGTVDHVIEILIMVSPGVFLCIFKKMQFCKY